MAGPLDGVRVVDLTSMVSGPLATMTLADQGADVVKIERPGVGDFTRAYAGPRALSASFLNNNRNKRSVALDLKDARGRAALMRIVAGADVFVQNFRPGVAERIGLGEAAIRAVARDIVYVSIAGFGFDGLYAQKPVYDPLVQALSGLTTVQAGSDEARPRLVRTILPDKLTGVQAAQAIVAALFARERTGLGQHVRLSMLDTIVAFLWGSDMSGHTFVGDEPESEEAQSFIDLIYETADGHIAASALGEREWAGLARALERPEWLSDPRFATAALRDRNRDERLRLTQAAITSLDLTTAAVLARLEAEDVPCAPVLTRREMIRHPQIAANGIVVESEHPAAGRIRQAAPPARFSETATEYRRGAPLLGEHTMDVLREAGLTAAEIEGLVTAGVAVVPRAASETGGEAV